MIWFILVGLFIVALAIVVWPLLRGRNELVPSQNNVLDNSQDIAVYKAQLEELVADQNNGLLSDDEVTSAKLEIERRLLKVADTAQTDETVTDTECSKSLLITASAVVLFLCCWLYMTIGMVGMPDFLLKDQDHSIGKLAEEKPTTPKAIEEIIAIKAHLIDNPNDSKAWRALGQYNSILKNRAESAHAFQRWHELEPDNVEAAVVFGESLIMLSEGRVPPAALLVLQEAHKIQPNNPGIRHYLALEQYQSGNVTTALANWKSLEGDSRPDAPWMPTLRHWIRQAQSDLEIPLDAEIDRAVAAPALSEEKRNAIADMSPEEQAEMIKSMVMQLQEKMDQNPENVEGWLRLANAYSVLGQKPDAIRSLQQAEKYADDGIKAAIKKQLDILLKQE